MEKNVKYAQGPLQYFVGVLEQGCGSKKQKSVKLAVN